MPLDRTNSDSGAAWVELWKADGKAVYVWACDVVLIEQITASECRLTMTAGGTVIVEGAPRELRGLCDAAVVSQGRAET